MLRKPSVVVYLAAAIVMLVGGGAGIGMGYAIGKVVSCLACHPGCYHSIMKIFFLALLFNLIPTILAFIISIKLMCIAKKMSHDEPCEPPHKPCEPPHKPCEPPHKPVNPPCKPCNPPCKPCNPPHKPDNPPHKPGK